MSRNYSNRGREGFTLIEAMISLTLLLIVLVLSMTFLFSMRTFAQRQELIATPRQIARRALNYVASNLMRASDLDHASSKYPGAIIDPNSIMIYYNAGATKTQATYNNLTATQSTAGYGDEGTDIINFQVPKQGLYIDITTWPGFGHSATVDVQYSDGCPSESLMLANFKAATGYDSVTGMSAILSIVDDNGNWDYYQITSYPKVGTGNISCSSATPSIGTLDLNNNAGLSSGINPPGGHPGLTNPRIAVTSYMALRVKNATLQQRNGLFNPTSPDAGFYTLIDNVEDLQVAYIYRDGTVWNTAHQVLTTNEVPGQVAWGTSPIPTRDITNVIGLRLTIVARSDTLPSTLLKGKRYPRPAAEDHAAGAKDDRYHYRLTSTVMIRNRMLGG